MNIFVLRTAALGDLILTLPVIEALTTIGHVHVATNSRFRSLLPPSVTPVDDSWVWSRAPHPYDLGITFSPRSAAALRDAGVPEVRHVSPTPPPGVHAVDHYAQVLAGLAYDPTPRIRGSALAFPRRLSHREGEPPLVVIAPGSGGREKCWPLESWLAVEAKMGVPVTWVWGPVEVEAGLPEGVPPLGGDVRPGRTRGSLNPDIEALVELASRADLWLGPDSGPSHLAAAVLAGQGREIDRVQVVFGPTNPACWAPRGARVWGWESSPDEIAAGVSRFLRNPYV